MSEDQFTEQDTEDTLMTQVLLNIYLVSTSKVGDHIGLFPILIIAKNYLWMGYLFWWECEVLNLPQDKGLVFVLGTTLIQGNIIICLDLHHVLPISINVGSYISGLSNSHRLQSQFLVQYLLLCFTRATLYYWRDGSSGKAGHGLHTLHFSSPPPLLHFSSFLSIL